MASRKRSDALSPLTSDAKRPSLRRSVSTGDLSYSEVNPVLSSSSEQCAEVTQHKHESEQSVQHQRSKTAPRKQANAPPASPLATLEVTNCPPILCDYVRFCKAIANVFWSAAGKLTAIRELRFDPENPFVSAFAIRGPRSVLTDICEHINTEAPFGEATAKLVSVKPCLLFPIMPINKPNGLFPSAHRCELGTVSAF